MNETTGIATNPHAPIPGFLSGGGELGALIRAHDWSSSPLGPPQHWPQSLTIAVRIMLASRQPIWIGWGDELTFLYNDAYKTIIGGKHPWALGQPTAVVWREIWDDIGPMLATARGGDQGTYVEAQLLVMERNGYSEETYYTFSYSPVPNLDGSFGGIICANSDDTLRVIGERQLALLQDLAARTADGRSWNEVCSRSATALAGNPRDLPFAMIYMAESDGKGLSLAGLSGIERGDPIAPDTVDLDQATVWPFAEVLRHHELRLVPAPAAGMPLPRGPWNRPPSHVAALPILPVGETGRRGVLIVGLNPFRLVDDGYKGFLGLVAGQISAAVASAEAYEMERRRAEALAEIDRAKTTFFSNVSHEFRTPLTLLMGPIEDALNDASSAALADVQKERLSVAHRNSLRLLKLVNSLLDFSRIEAGRVEASFVPTDLASVTGELASNFRSATERAGLLLRIECTALPEAVHIDREMWEKIVLNLLSNAFKFTFVGEIAVGLAASPDGRMAELTVRDSGVGIPPHALPRIFERFHRVEGQQSRSFEGSGIGLALVQELVKLQGGTIAVDSQPGLGTSFTVRIPFGTSHIPAERISTGRTAASRSFRAEAYVQEALRWMPDETADAFAYTTERGDDLVEVGAGPRVGEARILVADDNADMRDYVRRLLGRHWRIETVANGEAALAAISDRKPDLVLTDVMMPGLDGFGLLRTLRADAGLRDLPVILLSARAGEEARVEGIEAGADDYLTKPFAARELVARVRTNLELARVRREVTQTLRESEARFRNMADHSPMMMWVTDPSGHCIYLNRGWFEFTGQSEEEALGLGWLRAIHPDDKAEAEREFLEANAGRRSFRLEYRLRHRDGSYRWAIDTAAPRLNDGGEFRGYIGSVIEITERKEAEQVLQRANDALEERVASAIAERAQTEAQLRQAQKMEAVGKLTGGIAHDFNNVLQVVGGNLQLLTKDVAGNLRAEQRVQTALAGVSRGSKLASQLLAFGRRQPLAPRVINLGRLIRGVDDMLRRALGETIHVETVIAGGLWNTFVDTVHVENALLNLAINARDAMEGQGRLTIEAGNAFLDDAYAARHAEVVAGQYVVLAVTDTGCGIAPDIIEHVFEPFFTTKPEGQGTGLGLSMVYGFVKQSHGHIKIYSEPGQGTTVRIYLPRARGVEDVETDIETGPATGGTETVLVVEDDEDVRSTVVEMLSDLGYRVLKAKDAVSALAIVESGVPIDLVFTDVVMPGPMRSPELARKARERLPNVAVLFTSGYTENAIVHGGRLDEGVDLLSKPYTREALARKVRHSLRNRDQRVLAAGRGGARASAPERKPRIEAAPPRPLNVLLVEDEPLVRELAVEMLAELGHSVRQASNAGEALELLGREAFDVMVTDVGLPGTSGVELAADAARRLPGLRIVFASGYETVPGLNGGPLFTGTIVLRKPYDERGLAEALAASARERPELG